MGSTYLSLNPNAGSTSGAQSLSFLEPIFRAQSQSEIEQAATQFESVLLRGERPWADDLNASAYRIRFEASLIQAAKQVQKSTANPALKQQFNDADFIDNLVELSREYEMAGLHPTQAQDPAVKLFLDTLFRAHTEQQIRKGSRELATFLQGFNQPEERLDLLRMSKDLIDDEFGFPVFSSDKVPQQVEALLQLGRAYVALKPTDPVEGAEPLDFFLDTLYRAEGNQYIGKARIELQQFVQDFDSTEDKIRLLEFSENLLQAAKLAKDPELKAQSKDPVFIESLVELGQAYAELDPIESGATGQNLKFFLNTLWSTTSDLNKGSGELEDFLAGVDEAASFLNYEQKLITALKLVPAFQNTFNDPSFLATMSVLGSFYEFPYDGEEFLQNLSDLELDSSNFFHAIQEAQTEAELMAAAAEMQDLMEEISSIEDEEVYSVPIPVDGIQVAAAIAIPIILGSILLVAGSGLITIYWQQTSRDRQEVLRVIVNWTTETVESVTDRIMQIIAPWLKRLGVFAERALQEIRKKVEEGVNKIFKSENRPVEPSKTPSTSNQPRGIPTAVNPNPQGYNQQEEARSKKRENESAQTLAKEGYDVEQNPPPKANGKEPDYKIEGEYADCYAPNPNSVDSSVHRKISDKVSEGQADIIVVNADDAPNVSAEGIKAQIDEYPISGLRQVIVIKNGKVTNIIPSR